MRWILVVDLGWMCLFDDLLLNGRLRIYLSWLITLLWMSCAWYNCQIFENIEHFWSYVISLWIVPLYNVYLPWTLRTMSNLDLGVHCASPFCLVLKLELNFSKFFAIMPCLSILCLLRLIFTWLVRNCASLPLFGLD